ncbi:MAG: hypothetical protein M4D80_22360 [Myxococcota bacterium]|nr:hypothetical protein [Deltaproteobacteria bacterium]MDQ3337915.1 hypothetical protein [Myxococcota bacterium]
MSRFVFKLSLTLALTSFATTAFMPTASARAVTVEDQLKVPSTELRIAPPILDRAAVRAALLAQRRANIARFHAYRIGGVYPSNVFTNGSANVWQDQQGHFCAAATIIRASGEVSLVERIAEENNFFRIADVSQGPVMDWILTSGLTQAELVMIQKPFMPVTKRPELEPAEPIAVNPKLRAAETRRLAKLYKEIEAKLAKQQRANLELAVERLMKRPDLAQQLLGSSRTASAS